MIGVNTAIFSPNGGNVGIGFAIPASQAGPIIEQLEREGSVTRGWLGVEVRSMDRTTAEAVGFTWDDDVADGGVLVANVVDRGPADRAGIMSGDIALRFEGDVVGDVRTLVQRVARADADESVSLDVWRDGEIVSLDVVVGERQSDDLDAPDWSDPGTAGRPRR